MLTPLFLGVDSGLTTTKAVIVDAHGNTIGSACLPTPQSRPQPGYVERDPEEYWRVVAAVVRAVLTDAGQATTLGCAEISRNVAAIAPAAHGDGLLLLDRDLRPVGPMVLSTDSRASDVFAKWSTDGLLDEILKLSGQIPLVGGPAPLLAWFRDNDPTLLQQARWSISAKDWLCYRLTGTVGTDVTDVAATFTELAAPGYSANVASLYGLSDALGLLPPVSGSGSVAGTITASAAAETTLPEGTPVAAGIHDVQACLLAATGGRVNEVCIVGGTFGINLVLADSPTRDPRFICRAGPHPGTWAVMVVSLASAANLDWVLANLFNIDSGDKRAVATAVDNAFDETLVDPPIYIPYLFGDPAGGPGSAALLGLRSHHRRPDITRAVLEGITFNHRAQVEQLQSHALIKSVKLTGGIAHNDHWVQLFADILGQPIHRLLNLETGALGAAICAATASGTYKSLRAAASAMESPASVHLPDTSRVSYITRSFSAFQDYVAALSAKSAEPAAQFPAHQIPEQPTTGGKL